MLWASMVAGAGQPACIARRGEADELGAPVAGVPHAALRAPDVARWVERQLQRLVDRGRDLEPAEQRVVHRVRARLAPGSAVTSCLGAPAGLIRHGEHGSAGRLMLATGCMTAALPCKR